MSWTDVILSFRPCPEAIAWLATQPSAEQAWATCERGDWLLWVAACLLTDDAIRMLVVLAASDCAETALVHVPAGEDRPRACIETVRAWARGDASIDQVREARKATSAAASAARATFDFDAEDAALAALSAARAASAADAPALTSDAAIHAARAAAASATDEPTMRRLAGVVRARIPVDVMRAAFAEARARLARLRSEVRVW